MQNFDVIIIGGGISGISAAIELIKSKKSVCIIEANSKLGGRLNSKVDKNSNDNIDNGQHVFMGVYYNFFNILSQIGTHKYLHTHKGLNFQVKDKNSTYTLDTTKYFGKFSLLSGILNYNVLNIKEKISIIRFLLNIKNNNIDTDNLTCQELFAIYHQDRKIAKYLWNPFIEATLNTPPNLASAKVFTNILNLIFWKKNNASNFIIPTIGLSELIAPAQDFIKNNGGELLLNNTLKEIIYNLSDNNQSENQTNDSPIGIKTIKGETIHSKTIIIALPPHKLKNINLNFDKNNPIEKLNRFEYSPIISAYVWLNKKVLNYPILQLIDHNIQWIFDKYFYSNQKATYAEQLLSISISANNELFQIGNNELKNILSEELTQIFPTLANENIIQIKIIKEKKATFLCSNKIENLRTQLGKNHKEIIFAGDWVENNLPATIEGACINGINAANLALKNL